MTHCGLPVHYNNNWASKILKSTGKVKIIKSNGKVKIIKSNGKSQIFQLTGKDARLFGKLGKLRRKAIGVL